MSGSNIKFGQQILVRQSTQSFPKIKEAGKASHVYTQSMQTLLISLAEIPTDNWKEDGLQQDDHKS